MTQTTARFAFAPGVAPHATADALQARFALRVTARLTEQADELGPDLTERLRFAREKALERARAMRSAEATPPLGITRSGAAILGRSGGGWWMKIAAVAPIVALAGGLIMIQRWQDNTQISAAAEVDAALLSDNLPPTAYSDAGFAEFLKSATE